MKIRILFISLALLVVTNTISQTFKLNIEIENIEYQGTIYLAIYNNSTSFNQDNKNKNIDKKRWVKSIVEAVTTEGFKRSIELKNETHSNYTFFMCI